MEKFKQFIKKNRRIVVIAAVALFIVVLVAILASGSYYEPIDDDYFVSDSSKLVLSLSRESSNYEASEYKPDMTYIVYYYAGNKITNVRIFFDYGSEEQARKAYNVITMDDKDWASGRKLNGRYIIFSTKSEMWNGLDTDFVRQIAD